MRTWPLAFLLPLLAAGCTSAPAPGPAPVPAPVPAAVPAPAEAPAATRSDPPRVPYVRGHVLHLPHGPLSGSRLTIRLPLRGPWGLTSVVPVGGDFLVTDDRWFEGSVGMYRLRADGSVSATWTSTGPALPGPQGRAAWVSMVAPESSRTAPTLIHIGNRVQDIAPLFTPVLTAYDGNVVTFTALQKVGRTYQRRGFATDLVHPPRHLATSPEM